ncbi:MAG: hypothetical protein ABUS51_09920 [Acidobacteriota bacterium]
MRDAILGDLREEFCLRRIEGGTTKARLWYIRQFLFSLPFLIQPAGPLKALSVALPLILLDRLWCFIYSMIPMKDGLERAPGFLAANIVCGCLCAAFFRLSARWAAAGTALALALAVSAQLPVYVCIALVSVPLTARVRRSL